MQTDCSDWFNIFPIINNNLKIFHTILHCYNDIYYPILLPINTYTVVYLSLHMNEFLKKYEFGRL